LVQMRFLQGRIPLWLLLVILGMDCAHNVMTKIMASLHMVGDIIKLRGNLIFVNESSITKLLLKNNNGVG
jgi:hypothetical protein